VSEEENLPPLGVRQRGPVATGTRLLFIRHGESHANANGLAGGQIGDGGLTELGRRQAQALRDRLASSGELASASALYCSTLPRAIQTSQILQAALPAHLTAVHDETLVELKVGVTDGLTWREVSERFPAPNWDEDPSQPCAPGGESLVEFHGRCVEAIERLIERHPGELVVIVSHGGVIEQAMKFYQGLPAGARMRPRIENCSMTEIEFRGSLRRLLRFNDLAPLPATS